MNPRDHLEQARRKMAKLPELASLLDDSDVISDTEADSDEPYHMPYSNPPATTAGRWRTPDKYA